MRIVIFVVLCPILRSFLIVPRRSVRQPSSWHTANLNFYLEDMFLTLVLLLGPFPLEFFYNIYCTVLVYAPTDHNVIKSASEKRLIGTKTVLENIGGSF